MLGILATSVLTSPLRLAERLLWGRRVRRTAIDAAPIFIQGFARSGTTHLHNLIAHDPNLGYVSTFQAFASPFFMVSRGWLQRLIGKGLPSTRPMDNMAVSLDLPQEEELALAAVSDLSAVHQLSFPRRAKEIVAKMGAMRLTAREMSRWESCYLDVLRKATLATGGRRLVLKTPANLGRTPVLLRLFPDAKFVFIVRNPYVVFSSTMKLYRTMIPICQLQDVNWRDIEESMIANYADMTRRFLRHRSSIPEGNLAEVRFEDIENDPLACLEEIYATLGLPDWDQARGPIADYVATLGSYRKNRYRFDPTVIETVDREWGFAVREWGYAAPGVEDLEADSRLDGDGAGRTGTHERT